MKGASGTLSDLAVTTDNWPEIYISILFEQEYGVSTFESRRISGTRQTFRPRYGASVVPLRVNNHQGSSRSRGSGLLCKEPPQCSSLLAVGHWSLRSERPKYVFWSFAQSSMLTSEPGIARQRLCSPPEAFPLDPRVSLYQFAQDRMTTSL